MLDRIVVAGSQRGNVGGAVERGRQWSDLLQERVPDRGLLRVRCGREQQGGGDDERAKHGTG